MLVQYQRSWADLLWTKELFVRVTSRHKFLGGVFAHASDDRSTMHFKQLPSQSRNIEEREWTVDVRRFNWVAFTIDPVQDLLIVLARPERYVLRKAIISLFEPTVIGREGAGIIEYFYWQHQPEIPIHQLR